MSRTRFLALIAAAALFATVPAIPQALADNSETMDNEDGNNWRNQGGFQNGQTNNQTNNAMPPNFQCPAGWSCGPKKVKKETKAGCSSRFSPCYRNSRGEGSGGGDDD